MAPRASLEGSPTSSKIFLRDSVARALTFRPIKSKEAGEVCVGKGCNFFLSCQRKGQTVLINGMFPFLI
jgi:hypothetical protein